jgi:hypothetical protein
MFLRRVDVSQVNVKRSMLILSSLFLFLGGCAGPARTIVEPPSFPEGFLGARWGTSVDEAKKAIAKDGNEWYQDRLEAPPCAIYASGRYLDTPALFSYFFTPKSKRLYRLDVTFDDVKIHGKARNHLLERFGQPTYLRPDGDHWSWRDKSLVIFQLDPTHVQISYLSGPLAVMNYEETTGVVLR